MVIGAAVGLAFRQVVSTSLINPEVSTSFLCGCAEYYEPLFAAIMCSYTTCSVPLACQLSPHIQPVSRQKQSQTVVGTAVFVDVTGLLAYRTGPQLVESGTNLSCVWRVPVSQR